MYEYKAELLRTRLKKFSGLFDENRAGELDKLINERSKCNWKLVTYSYIKAPVNDTGTENIFIVTFTLYYLPHAIFSLNFSTSILGLIYSLSVAYCYIFTQ